MLPRHKFMSASALQIHMNRQSTSRLAFSSFLMVSRIWQTGLQSISVQMSVWNLFVNTESLFLICWKRPVMSFGRTQNTPSHRKVTKLTARTQSGTVTCPCAIWLSPAWFRAPFYVFTVIIHFSNFSVLSGNNYFIFFPRSKFHQIFLVKRILS